MKRKTCADRSWLLILEFVSGPDCAALMLVSKHMRYLTTKDISLRQKPEYWVGKVRGSLGEIVQALSCLGNVIDRASLQAAIIQIQTDGLTRVLREAEEYHKYVPFYANSITHRLHFQ